MKSVTPLRKTKMRGMLRSPLFRRFLLPIIGTIIALIVAIYFLTVPFLKNLVYSMEEKAVLTNLNNVHELVKANYLAIQAYKESVLAAHKRQLKNITLFQEAYIKSKYEEYKSGLLSEEEAKWAALEELRRFRYGNNNYVWVADLNGVFLSHPDDQMQMRDFSEVRDVFGNYVLTPLIEKAIANNEGYHSYWWQRLGEDLPAEQLTYGRLFPEWNWIIGTGVYLDDLETEVILRKEKMIEELRHILRPITVARTGYMYIFDAWQNIIIHPDPSLENTSMSAMVNPQTGKPLAEGLMTAAGSPEHKLTYRWDRPTDRNHFIYDKIDWVRYVEGFDWYIAASVYTDELNATAMELRRKIILIALAAFFFTAIVIGLLVSRMLRPIQQLSATAQKVEEGDLAAQCGVTSKDEIGFLAASFNRMVNQLRTNIEELDHKVMERTRELDIKNTKLEQEIDERKRMQDEVTEANRKLTNWVDKLEQHNREITQLNKMGELLQASHSLEETYTVIRDTATALFPTASGGLYMVNADSQQLELVCNWLDYLPADGRTTISPDECWGIRRGKMHILAQPGDGQACTHLTMAPPCLSLCLPLIGQNDILGLLHLQFPDQQSGAGEEERATLFSNRKRLATAVADHLAMAMANLLLREKLHHLSVRDGLTGLFNRRYMEETLIREFKRADRQQDTVGLIILDVDFFKKFNDTYGHEAGDVVLKELAALLQHKIREGDVACRYGGEEFVLILPGSDCAQTSERAEEIRKSVADELAIHYQEHVFTLTISLGVSCYPQLGSNKDAVLNAADSALYQAKENGRNRVGIAPSRP